jgi:hypothetical protein
VGNCINPRVAHLGGNCAIVIYEWLKLANLWFNFEVSNSCHLFPLSLELVRSLAEATDIFGIRQKFVLRRKKVDTHYRNKKNYGNKKSPESESLFQIIRGKLLGYK